MIPSRPIPIHPYFLWEGDFCSDWLWHFWINFEWGNYKKNFLMKTDKKSNCCQKDKKYLVLNNKIKPKINKNDEYNKKHVTADMPFTIRIF